MKIPILNLKKLLVLLTLGSAPILVTAQDAQDVNFTLKQYIDYGLAHHPSVKVYELQVQKSKQQAIEQLSQYLPQVNISAGLDNNLKLQQTIIPEGTFGPGTPEQRIAFGQKYNSSMTAQLDQPIYNQSLITGLKANKPNNELAILNEEENKQNIIYNISKSYFQIIILRKQLELLQSNKERLEKVLKVTDLQSEMGVAKKVDVKQVQVNLNNVLSQIKQVNNNLQLAENTLKNYSGLPLSTNIIIADLEKWTGNQQVTLNTMPFNYHRTFLFQKQEKQLELLSINAKRIKHQIYPTLSIYGRYGALGFGENLEKTFNPLLDFSTIGLKLSWAAFTGMRRSAQYKQALIDYDIAKIDLNNNDQLAQLQYENASLQLQNANNNIRLNNQNMELAREVYDNTTLQYNEGVATLSDLLNAELSYREAQNIYLNGLVDFYIADLDVQNNNNTLQDFYNSL